MTNQNSDLDELSADELRERLIALQEENKVLTDLFYSIVHDLRTPLGMIAAAAHLLLDEVQGLFPPLDEEQSALVKILKDNAVHVNEVDHQLVKLVERAKTLGNLGSSLVKDYHRQLFDAGQQLEKMKLKDEATQYALQDATNKFMNSANYIIGYSQLYLKQPELMGGPLNKEQLEGIETVHRYGEEILETIQYYFFHYLRAIESVDADPAPEEMTLAEIGEMIQFSIESELVLDTAVFINKREAETVIKLLDSAWDRKSKGGVLKVIAETEGQIRFVLPSTTKISSYHVKTYGDEKSGRLHSPERERYLDPVGLATALVEKQGGAVYAELGSDSTYSLSFTLPVYREES